MFQNKWNFILTFEQEFIKKTKITINSKNTISGPKWRNSPFSEGNTLQSNEYYSKGHFASAYQISCDSNSVTQMTSTSASWPCEILSVLGTPKKPWRFIRHHISANVTGCESLSSHKRNQLLIIWWTLEC